MIKIGILSFAHMHAYGYTQALKQLPNVALVGIADDNIKRGKQAAKHFKSKFYNKYKDLVKISDAVVITSENAKHKDLTILAATAGKHILCEKPISVSLTDAQVMIDICKKNRVKLQTAFPCRFAASVIRAKQVIDDGKIGKILAIRGTNHGRMPGGWFIDKRKSGGGAVMDHTVHVADLIRWITRQEFTEVYAEIDTRYYKMKIDDCGILSMKMSGGTFCTLDPSWSIPKVYPTWGDVTMRIIGEKGVIYIDAFKQRVNLYNNKDIAAKWIYWGPNIDMGLVKSFIDAIENDTPVCITGEDGLLAMELALGAYQSAKKAKPVRLPLE